MPCPILSSAQFVQSAITITLYGFVLSRILGADRYPPGSRPGMAPGSGPGLDWFENALTRFPGANVAEWATSIRALTLENMQ
jgi:hypothetical protein